MTAAAATRAPAPPRAPVRSGGGPGTTGARPWRTRTAVRMALLLPGGLALLLGMDAALGLLGLPQLLGRAPVLAPLPDVHGPLMVLGFVGTLVALERAVALGRAWGYAAPATSGLAVVALVAAAAPGWLGPALLVLAQVLVLAVYRGLHARQGGAPTTVQSLGALMALGAAVLWAAGVAVPALTPWLAGYLVLTIFGERLELARLELLTPTATHAAVAVATAVLTAAVVALLAPGPGFVLTGVALLAVAGWLAARDVARRTVRGTGLVRFAAACLLAGYLWLAVGGAIWALGGPVTGRGYDAVLHAIMVGFVLSMIMAHAPVILPAVLRRPLPYRRAMYAPAALLHASLVLRLAVGDAHDLAWAVQLGGALNIVAVLSFVAVAAWSATTARTTGAAR